MDAVGPNCNFDGDGGGDGAGGVGGTHEKRNCVLRLNGIFQLGR